MAWDIKLRERICKNPKCRKVFVTKYSNKLYCCSDCKYEHHKNLNNEKCRKERAKKNEVKPKVKRMDIVSAIAKVTELSFGVVSELYPNLEKILAKAKYEQSIGRAKPIKIEDYRKINISKEHTACFLLGC